MQFEYTKEAPDHISVSQVNTYLKCQVQWYWKYLTDVPRPNIARLIHAVAAHNGIAHHLNQRMHGAHSIKESIELAQDHFNTKTKDIDLLFDKVFFNKDVAISSLNKILTQALPEIDEIIKYPMLTEWKLENSERAVILSTGQKVVGIIDCVDSEGNIYDFKVTGNTNNIQNVIQSLQLGVYAFFIQPTKKVGLISISNKTGKVTPVSVPCSVQRGERAIMALDMAAKNIQSSIKNHSFIPNTEGWHCSSTYCDYHAVCPWGGRNE